MDRGNGGPREWRAGTDYTVFITTTTETEIARNFGTPESKTD